jgi:hypothetical protein
MNSKRKALSILFAGALFSGALMAGCTAPNPVRIVPLVGAPAYPPVDPSTVLVLRTEPQRPYATLGQIVLEPQGVLSVTDIEQKLRQAGASIGASAVVILSDMTMVTAPVGSDSSGGQVVSAIAIRFTD